MDKQLRILISGAAGFIGAKVTSSALAAGHEVVLVDRLQVNGFRKCVSIAVDLLDSAATIAALSPQLPLDVVIHLAALAYNQAPPSGHDIFSVNVGMTQSLLRAVEPCNPHFLFASSVAVYGEDGRGGIISASDVPQPATEYGRSKLECERILGKHALSDIEVLRFAPVYSSERLKDVSKRVLFPGLSNVRMWFFPEPRYSLCNIDRVGQRIMDLIVEGRQGRRLRNVCDQNPYGQHQIASWFEGPRFPVFTLLGLPFAAATRMLPGGLGYRIRCDLHKLLYTHLYDSQSVTF